MGRSPIVPCFLLLLLVVASSAAPPVPGIGYNVRNFDQIDKKRIQRDLVVTVDYVCSPMCQHNRDVVGSEDRRQQP